MIRIWLTAWLAADASAGVTGMPAELPWFIPEGLVYEEPNHCRPPSGVPG